MSTEDEKKHARERAEQMEENLELLEKDERHTIELMEKLDKLATALRAHAEGWEEVNPIIATRVREQEHDVHRLHSQLAEMAEMEADAQTKLMTEIDRVLRKARGED